MDAVRHTAIDSIALADYFPPEDAYEQVYHRVRLEASEEDARRFARRVNGEGHLDGALLQLGQPKLGAYLAESKRDEPAESFIWPGEGGKNSAGFFLEFDPPLEYLPETIRVDQQVVYSGEARAFNRSGRPVRSGTLSRGIWLEGHENITADGIEYRDCVRIRTETSLRLHWGPHVDLTEYLWLAPKLGEVRRLERFSSRLFPFIFDETYVYGLAADESTRPMLAAERPARALPWRRVAVYLDRVLPNPRVGGTVVEYAEVSTAPNSAATTAPARTP